MRLKRKSSAGGHNGLLSIERIYGQDYHRLKIGIGGRASPAHVMGEFAPGAEAALAQSVVAKAAEACEFWLKTGPEGLDRVMCKVNGPDFRLAALPDAASAALPPTAATTRTDTPSTATGGSEATPGETAVKDKGDEIRALKEKLRAQGIVGKRLSEHTEVAKLVTELDVLKATR